jgi:hypothetical protein
MNLPFEDDDNRIDWEKKQKSSRDRSVEIDTVTEDTEVILRKPKKKARKNRQLEYDDENGRMIVKRQRKRRQKEWDDLW